MRRVRQAHGDERRVHIVGMLLKRSVAGTTPTGVAVSGAPPAADSRALQKEENYGRQEVVWSQGPSIESKRVVPLSRLSAALASAVPAATGQNVGTAALEKRYGPRRRVAMVVLRGTYNSLPPDEGVNVSGDVVILVDVKTDRVLVLTA